MSEHRRGKGCGEEGHDPETCHCFLHVEVDTLRARAERAEAELQQAEEGRKYDWRAREYWRARAEKAEAALEEAIRIGVVVTQTKSDKTLIAERDAALARIRELESADALTLQNKLDAALARVRELETEDLAWELACDVRGARITELEESLRELLGLVRPAVREMGPTSKAIVGRARAALEGKP